MRAPVDRISMRHLKVLHRVFGAMHRSWIVDSGSSSRKLWSA
ncbi:hypothetical protein I546_3488 [Mycobacterium kansasii 732]|nr:hypothetical protein I546_3488 [Mycobacterium kansasii 732]